MDVKKKLVELIRHCTSCEECRDEDIADHLIANGVTVQGDELPTNLMAIPVNADFGTVLNCAVRYAIGRRTYMPGLVIDFIHPLLPFIDDNTLWVLDKDIEEAARISLGDPIIDEPVWKSFHESVKNELRARLRK